MIVLSWLRRWGWLILFGVGAVAVTILTAGKIRPDIGLRLKIAQAEAKAEKLQATMNHTEAVNAIEAEHKDAVAKLDAQEKAQAESLRSDPKELSKFLVRAGAKQRTT